MLRRLYYASSIVVVVSVLLLWGALSGAEIPHKINYQARLTDTATGEPLVGSYSMEFRLYDAVTAGTAFWSETQTVDIGQHGIMSVILGSETEIVPGFEAPVWLEVVIEGEVLSPRREIVSVPFAFVAGGAYHAADSDSLGGRSHAAYALRDSLSVTGILNDAANPVDWTRLKNVPAGFADGVDDGLGDGYSLDASDGQPVDAVYVDEVGHVGVGTTTPQGPLHIYGGASDAAPEGGSELVVEDDGNARINLLSPNDAYPGLLFGDPENNSAGWLIYNHGEDKLRVGVNDAERLTITSDGNVGIGKSNASERLEVNGAVKAVASGEGAQAVIGDATSTGYTENHGGHFTAAGVYGVGVFGKATSTGTLPNYGGWFEADASDGIGIVAQSTKSGGHRGRGGRFYGGGNSGVGILAVGGASGPYGNYGGYFVAHGDSGKAVCGVATSTASTQHFGGYFSSPGQYGRGVYGEASKTGTGHGVGGEFIARGYDAIGVSGQAVATGDHANFGGYFTASGDEGRAVYAVANSTNSTSVNYGGYFVAHCKHGIGVYGRTTGDIAWAVRGLASGAYGYGVYGEATGTGGSGVYGRIQSNNSTARAIYGQASGYPNAYAGYFQGRVHVAGTLTKTTDDFLIDHPADPENRILRHSVVESPEYLLIYKGRASLEDGTVTVDLPGYFEALVHPDGREIVLTCVNSYTPLYLEGGIADGHFTVRTVDGGVPDQEFSWVIYGTRNDAWVQEHPLVVEEDKTPDGEFRRGEYLNPEAFRIAPQAAQVLIENVPPGLLDR